MEVHKYLLTGSGSVEEVIVVEGLPCILSGLEGRHVGLSVERDS